MFYDKNKPIYKKTSLENARDHLYEMYVRNNLLQMVNITYTHYLFRFTFNIKTI